MSRTYARILRDVPIVLLHGCYAEMLAFTRQAFGVAPVSKLMYSSDGIGVPELHWMGALDGRRVLGQVLGELVACGEMDNAEAAGVGVLRENAVRLYRL